MYSSNFAIFMSINGGVYMQEAKVVIPPYPPL